MAFNLKFPLPSAIQGVFAAIFLKLSGLEDKVANALEADFPGAGAKVKAAFDLYAGPANDAINAAAIFTKAAVELGDAVRTLHAFAKPDLTDAG